jgi:hypothetical protein
MGWGDFGSNGSVHWRIHHHDLPDGPVNGSGIDEHKRHPVDTQTGPRIGGEKAPKPDHSGKFRVTARFQTPAAAQSALNAAKVVGNDVVLDVSVWPTMKNSAGAFTLPEVTVDW